MLICLLLEKIGESELQRDACLRPDDSGNRGGGTSGSVAGGGNPVNSTNHSSSLGGNSLANSNSNGGSNLYSNGDGGASGMDGRRGSGRGSYGCVSSGGGSNNGGSNAFDAASQNTSNHQQQNVHPQQQQNNNTQQHRDTSGGGVTGGVSRVVGPGGRRAQRLPSLRLANGRVTASGACLTGSDEEVRSPRSAAAAAAAQALREDIKISLDTTTCTDSLITAVEDETAFVNEFISHEMNFKEPGKVHFGGDDISLYGTPKEEMMPSQVPTAPPTPGVEPKPSFLKNQLQALFQPTDNKLAMKLFGSKKALMKERIRQKAAGHWIIHPCSNFRPAYLRPIPCHLAELRRVCQHQECMQAKPSFAPNDHSNKVGSLT
ncbi:Ion transport N-terminal [Trinorchestia longiramus]|nr:Ion transport N-terminal [Trinorchestia longiramus]